MVNFLWQMLDYRRVVILYRFSGKSLFFKYHLGNVSVICSKHFKLNPSKVWPNVCGWPVLWRKRNGILFRRCFVVWKLVGNEDEEEDDWWLMIDDDDSLDSDDWWLMMIDDWCSHLENNPFLTSHHLVLQVHHESNPPTDPPPGIPSKNTQDVTTLPTRIEQWRKPVLKIWLVSRDAYYGPKPPSFVSLFNWFQRSFIPFFSPNAKPPQEIRPRLRPY